MFRKNDDITMATAIYDTKGMGVTFSPLISLLKYILSLPFSDAEKDWLAGKIIESKTKDVNIDTSAEADFYSLCGSWANDAELEHIEDVIAESRQSNVTRQLANF